MTNNLHASLNKEMQEIEYHLKNLNVHELKALAKKLSLKKYSNLKVQDLRPYILHNAKLENLYGICFPREQLNQKWTDKILSRNWGSIFSFLGVALAIIFFVLPLLSNPITISPVSVKINSKMGDRSFPINISNNSKSAVYSVNLKLTLEPDMIPISSLTIALTPSDSNTFTPFEFELDGEKLTMDLPCYILIQGIDESEKPALYVQIPMVSPFETRLFTCKIDIPELPELDAEMKITYLGHSTNPPKLFSEGGSNDGEWVRLGKYVYEPIPDLKKIASGSNIKISRRLKH